MQQKIDTASNLVIGLGEVGSALRDVLECDGHDPKREVLARGTYDVVHIAFPYDPTRYDFVKEVEDYRKRFEAKLVVVHSTVPIGTSCALKAVHSPIRGVHPHLATGIRTFVKFFGGERAADAARIFEAKGVRTACTPRSEDTEAAKLWDTTQYGAMILLNKEIRRFCEHYGLDFDVVYTAFNRTYNEGYIALGRSEVVRPHLAYMEGPIGGHCVVPNARLFESETPQRILDADAMLRAAAKSESPAFALRRS